jgi:Zn finger protein HypA/HybF involved in hydrogenase expression
MLREEGGVLDDSARLVRYLCLSCGSQGVQHLAQDAKGAVCPRCGSPATTDLEIRAGESAQHA